MTDTVEILDRDLAFPEGPAFDSAGNLWCVELKGGQVTRWSPEGATRVETGGTPNGLLFDARGRGWIANSQLNAIQQFDPTAGEITTVVDAVDGEPLNGPNDLAFDSAGSLLFTCPGGSDQESRGYVCCLTPDGRVRKIGEGFFFPNGLALVDGGSALVVAETQRQRLWKGAWEAASHTWRDPQPWAELGDPAGPDGMALGADGLLYVAIYSAGEVRAVDQDGRVTKAYELPGNNPTNAAFDPSGRLGLVVTETERGVLLSLPELGPGVPLFDGGDAWD